MSCKTGKARERSSGLATREAKRAAGWPVPSRMTGKPLASEAAVTELLEGGGLLTLRKAPGRKTLGVQSQEGFSSHSSYT